MFLELATTPDMKSIHKYPHSSFSMLIAPDYGAQKQRACKIRRQKNGPIQEAQKRLKLARFISTSLSYRNHGLNTRLFRVKLPAFSLREYFSIGHSEKQKPSLFLPCLAFPASSSAKENKHPPGRFPPRFQLLCTPMRRPQHKGFLCLLALPPLRQWRHYSGGDNERSSLFRWAAGGLPSVSRDLDYARAATALSERRVKVEGA